MHHRRRPNDSNIVIVTESIKRNLIDMHCYHTGLKPWCLGIIQSIDRVELFRLGPHLTFFIKERTADILKTGDQIQPACLFRMVVKIVQSRPHRRKTRSAADDEKIFIRTCKCFLHRPGMAKGTAHVQHASFPQIEHTIGQTSDLADRELLPALALGADGDRRLADLRDRQHAELPVMRRFVKRHAESKLRLGLMSHTQDLVGLRLHYICVNFW